MTYLKDPLAAVERGMLAHKIGLSTEQDDSANGELLHNAKLNVRFSG